MERKDGGNNLPSPQETEDTDTLTGFVRMVSEEEAKTVLERHEPFSSNEVFEVWNGCLPGIIYSTLDTSDTFDPNETYRKVLFIPVATVLKSVGRLQPGIPHPQYSREYPAIRIRNLNFPDGQKPYNQQFQEGEVIDVTSLVEAKIKNLSTTSVTAQQARELAKEPLINNFGQGLT